APVISGVVALLEATRSDLNPGNSQLTAAQRAAIPDRIRHLLTDNAVVTTDPADPSITLKVVNPYQSMRAAAAGILPDAEAIGGPNWFSDFAPTPQDPTALVCGGQDNPATGYAPGDSVFLTAGQSCKSSIVTIEPTEGLGGLTRFDQDVNYWSVAAPPSLLRYTTTVTVSSPPRATFGYVGLDGQNGIP